MAGDWIAWTKGLERKPEVIRIASRLGVTHHDAAARLMVVWCWADETIGDDCIREDGVGVVKMSPVAGDNARFVDHLSGLPGFADSMSSEGWIFFRHDRIEFPNFARWNGETAKNRMRNSKNQRKKRRRAAPTESPQMPPDDGDVVTEMSPAHGDKLVTRERGKRRVNTPLPPKGDGGDMRWIGKPQLEQPSAVLAWLSAYGPKIGLADVRDIRLRVLACAVRAAHPTARDPAAVFRSLVQAGAGGDWSKIADEMEQAKRTLKGIENGGRERDGDTESATLGELARAALGRTDAAGGG